MKIKVNLNSKLAKF